MSAAVSASSKVDWTKIYTGLGLNKGAHACGVCR